jgi:hypothetical protein
MMQVEAIGLMLDRGGDDAREQACSMLQYLSFPKETIADGVDMLFERFVRCVNKCYHTLVRGLQIN